MFFLLTLTNLVHFLDAKKNERPPKENRDRNKFFEVSSPIMPRCLHQWATASRKIGQHFDQNQRARPGVPQGYCLPEPALFVNHADETVGQAYLTTYLKLRPLLIYRVTNMGINATLSGPEWRKVLGLEVHSSKAGSRTAEVRNKLVTEMQQSLSGSSLVRCYYTG